MLNFFLIFKCFIDAVEIDPKVYKVAKDWFGLIEDEKLKVNVDDALKYVNNAAKQGKLKKNIK